MSLEEPDMLLHDDWSRISYSKPVSAPTPYDLDDGAREFVETATQGDPQDWQPEDISNIQPEEVEANNAA